MSGADTLVQVATAAASILAIAVATWNARNYGPAWKAIHVGDKQVWRQQAALRAELSAHLEQSGAASRELLNQRFQDLEGRQQYGSRLGQLMQEQEEAIRQRLSALRQTLAQRREQLETAHRQRVTEEILRAVRQHLAEAHQAAPPQH